MVFARYVYLWFKLNKGSRVLVDERLPGLFVVEDGDGDAPAPLT